MREASLIELMESLPKTHIARLEYIKFLSRLSEEKNERLHLEQENSRLKTDNSILEGDYQRFSIKLSDTYKQLADLKEENSDNESLLSQLEQEVKELVGGLQLYRKWFSMHAPKYAEMPTSGEVKKQLAEHDKQVAVKVIEELKHRIIECREMELSQGDVYTIDMIAEQLKQEQE